MLGKLYAPGSLCDVRLGYASLCCSHLGPGQHVDRYTATYCQRRRYVRDRLLHASAYQRYTGRFEFKKLYPDGTDWINSGHSCIIAPNGKIMAGPLVEKEEILYAEIDLKQVTAAKRRLDVAGHYARPDVFKFEIDQSVNPMMSLEKTGE